MSDDSRLDVFLDRVRRIAGGSGGRTDALTDEIRDHVISAIEDLRRDGLDAEEAERVALARFGAPEAVFGGHHQEVDVMTLWMTRATMLLAAITTTIATVVVIHAAAFDDGGAAFESVKIAQGALVIAVGLMTLRYWSRGRIQSVEAVVGAGIWFAISGLAAAVWTVRLGQTTGDLEAWAVLANLMIAAQGILLGWMAMTKVSRT